MRNTFGNCAKHPNFSMINCPECRIEEFRKLDYDNQELFLQKLVNEVATSSNIHSRNLFRKLLEAYAQSKQEVEAEEALKMWERCEEATRKLVLSRYPDYKPKGDNFSDFIRGLQPQEVSAKVSEEPKVANQENLDQAGVIAVRILEKIKPQLSAGEEAIFIAGFQEAVKIFNIEPNPEVSDTTKDENEFDAANKEIIYLQQKISSITDKEKFYQQNVLNPYPGESQSSTAYKKGFYEAWDWIKANVLSASEERKGEGDNL